MDQKAPTFQLEPKEDERFFPSKVRKVIESVLNDRLKDEEYDPNKSPALCEELAKSIRYRVKDEVRLDRYKLAIQVVMGEIKGQGLRITSKCLWDPNFDNWASYTFSNEKFYATGMVFGTYFE